MRIRIYLETIRDLEDRRNQFLGRKILLKYKLRENLLRSKRKKLADLCFLFFFQLSELEQRVLEAEGRADEAEDKVRINYNRHCGEIPPPVFLRDTTTDRAARFSTR